MEGCSRAAVNSSKLGESSSKSNRTLEVDRELLYQVWQLDTKNMAECDSENRAS